MVGFRFRFGLAVIATGVMLGAGAAALAAEASNVAGDPGKASTLKPPSVSVAVADRRAMVATSVVAGTLVAKDEILISPEVEGLVAIEILVDEGSHVEKGEVLARLNRAALDVQMLQNRAQLARLDAGLLQADAQIAEAEANKVQTEAAYKRAVQLQASGSTSAEVFDQRANAARTADARRTASTHALAMISAERAQTLATIDETALKIARTEIRTPAAGVVARRNIRLGAVASASSEPLFKIIGSGLIELEAEVPEAVLPRLKPGQPVAVKPAGVEKSLKGSIRLVSPEVDRSTRLGRIRVALPESAAAFIGAFARGKIETGREEAVTVPLSALTYQRSGPALQIVKEGVIETRPVTLGVVSDGRAGIAEGLQQGELVVAKAGTFVHDGDKVTPVLSEDAPR